MKATDQLRDEHEGIKLMLDILTAVSERVGKGEPVPRADLEAIVEFLSVFADKCHHGKEDDFLFPALEAAGIPRQGGPIGVMLAEHTMGRGFVARLKELIQRYPLGNAAATRDLRTAAGNYVALLTQHIAKENNVLFPVADARLSAGEDDELVNAFEKIEHERVGHGKHEEFHRLLDRLEATYLS